MSEWKEGARSGFPDDTCPHCGAPGCVFRSDFRKFGKHSVSVCLACKTVTADGDSSPLEVYVAPDPSA